MDSAEVAQRRLSQAVRLPAPSEEAVVWASHFPGEYGIRLPLVSILLSVT